MVKPSKTHIQSRIQPDDIQKGSKHLLTEDYFDNRIELHSGQMLNSETNNPRFGMVTFRNSDYSHNTRSEEQDKYEKKRKKEEEKIKKDEETFLNSIGITKDSTPYSLSRKKSTVNLNVKELPDWAKVFK